MQQRSAVSAEPLSILMAAAPLPAAEVVALGRAICAALTGVHGELSPSAITIADGTATIEPAGAQERSRYGQYASPERVVGKAATGASDVFSIGAILYHALAGRPPFRGETPTAMMLAACTETPDSVPFDVPRELAAVIQRSLEKDAEKRYESPAALAMALTTHQRQGNWAGKRILAADDDAPIRALYTHVAGHVGVEADIVASGRDAIEALKTRNYDVALLDLNMARLSGWEVLDFLRNRYRERPRHLFIVTGFSDQLISPADREVVTGVLYKPFAIDELRQLVTECLRGGEPDLGAILKTTSHRAVS
jgi:CheY-like chemotaxis protein